MNKRNEVVEGVMLMSAAASQATEDIMALMPDEIDMQVFLGIVGNLCLRYGVTGKKLRTFNSGLTEFVDLMDEQIKATRQ